MSEFKLCKNGHYYATSLDSCPYCPKPGLHHSGPNQLKNTVISNLHDSNWDHTKIEVPVEATPPVTPPAPSAPVNNPLARTQIYSPESATGHQAARKLVGWLVTYSLNPFGTDYRLYEGRNLIGADPAGDVVVAGDPAVSARHLTILYRTDGFRFKDEFSTNGTFVNGDIRDEGILQDGDSIRIGSTVFKFRSAL